MALMKSMSLVQYAREVQTATTLPARASLYVRSLGLRYGLWKNRKGHGAHSSGTSRKSPVVN